MGQSPTHLACLRQDMDSLRILMSAGANPNTEDRLGITPLAYCISNGMEKFAHLLIDGGGKEDLDKLKFRISDSFRKNLLQRLHNPPSLLELSRRSLIQHIGPYYRDWVDQYRDNVPKSLHPFMKFEQHFWHNWKMWLFKHLFLESIRNSQTISLYSQKFSRNSTVRYLYYFV